MLFSDDQDAEKPKRKRKRKQDGENQAPASKAKKRRSSPCPDPEVSCRRPTSKSSRSAEDLSTKSKAFPPIVSFLLQVSGSEERPDSPSDSLDGTKKGERKKEFVCQVGQNRESLLLEKLVCFVLMYFFYFLSFPPVL